MNISGWSNITLGLSVVSVVLVPVTLFPPKGIYLYVVLLMLAIIVGYFTVITYRSSDRKQIELKVKEAIDGRYNVFEGDKYIAAVQTNQHPLKKISELIDETYGKEEVVEMLNFLEEWKKENNFKWDHTTLYDELLIEVGYDKKGIKYNINHVKKTNSFKIKGVLLKSGTTGKESKELKGEEKQIENYYYTINGLSFRLSNVLPKYEGKYGEWTLSTKKDETVKYEEGMITDAVFSE